jgi:3-deoxy-7-phosphoheptulonate synthase
MQNYELLKAAGRIKKPIILKNGLGSGLDEFLSAAEYILKGGNKNVILCLRGTKPLQGSGSRFALDLSSFAVLRHLTHLPIIGDPTHPADHHLIVPSVSMGIAACGADGLLVEVHPDPKSALTGRQQLLDYDEFAKTMVFIKRILWAIGRE